MPISFSPPQDSDLELLQGLTAGLAHGGAITNPGTGVARDRRSSRSTAGMLHLYTEQHHNWWHASPTLAASNNTGMLGLRGAAVACFSLAAMGSSGILQLEAAAVIYFSWISSGILQLKGAALAYFSW